MSIEAMNWALAQKTGSPAAKSVLLILANRADHRGVCWPGITGIAEQTELSRRAVINNLQALESAGLLVVTKRQNPLTNIYRLSMGTSAGGALVQEMHQLPTSAPDAPASARGAPELVQEVHLPSARRAPKPKVTVSRTHKNPKKAKRVPADFELDDALKAFAREKGMTDGVIADEFGQFKDHEYKDARSDWPAAWRTWVRNWKKWRPKSELSDAEDRVVFLK